MLGYSVVYMAMNNDVVSTSSNQINGDETITVKMAMSLPYQSNFSGYEPAEGRVQKGNNIYKMVERTVINDTLYTVCKVDYSARERFFDLADHIANHVSDSADRPLNKSAKLLKNFIKEYHTSNTKTLFFVYEWIAPATTKVEPNLIILSHYDSLNSPPPDFC